MLFTSEQAQTLRLGTQELDYYKALNASNEKIIKLQQDDMSLYEQRVNNYKEQTVNLEDRLAKANNTFFSNLGFFVLGVVTTTAIAYAVSHATK